MKKIMPVYCPYQGTLYIWSKRETKNKWNKTNKYQTNDSRTGANPVNSSPIDILGDAAWYTSMWRLSIWDNAFN